MAGIVLMGFNTVRVAGWPISDLVFLVAAGAVGFNLLAGRTSGLAAAGARRSSPPVLMGTILLLTAGTLSAFQSWEPGRSITVVLRFAWITLGWFWVLRSVAADRAALAKLLGAWRVMLLVNCVIAMLGQLDVVAWAGVQENEHRQTGFFETPNDFAGLLVVGLPLMALGLPNTRGRSLAEGRELVARGWGAAFVVYALATTGSMSALVAAFAGGVTIVTAMVVAKPPRVRPARSPLLPMLAAFLALVGFVALASSDLPAIERFTRYNEGDAGVNSSVESRDQRNEQVIERFDESLVVGQGFGGYDQSDEGAAVAAGAHNMFMRIVFQAGLPGLVGVVAVLLFSVRQVTRLIVNTRGTDLHAVAVCLLAALVTANTFAMFQPTEFHRYYWMPVGMIGVLWSLRREELRDAAATSGRVPSARVHAAGAAGAATGEPGPSGADARGPGRDRRGPGGGLEAGVGP
jgi:O-antigen ligase